MDSAALKPAREVAAAMSRPTRGASPEYLAARTGLLAEEIELRRQTERVAERRRLLPPGPVVEQDYLFRTWTDAGPAELRFSALFEDGVRDVVVYCYMFPRHRMDGRAAAASGRLSQLPREEQPCPSCTALLDQLDAAARHLEAGGTRLVAVANTSIENLRAVAEDRGWRHLRLCSSAGTSFKHDFHAEDPDGQQEPMTLVFRRDDDGRIRLFWASDLVWTNADPGQDHRAAGTLDPLWNLFDLTASGRPDFDEQLEYDGARCCSR